MEEEIKRRKKVKAKPVKKIKLGKIILIFAGLFYLFMFINAFFGQMAKTYVVTYGKIEDSDNANGYIIRDEKVITSNSVGVLKPERSEGERVSRGSIVARIFNDSASEVEKDIADIDEKIQRVINENEKNNLIKLNFSEDIKKLDSDTEQKIFELTKANREEDFEKVNEIKDEIDENIRKKAQISGQLGQASQYIRNLTAQRQTLQNTIASMKQNIITDSAGVVSYSSDGLEKVLTPEIIQSLTIEKLEQLSKQIDSNKSESTNAIRIIDNFKCYICTVIQDKDRVKKIKPNDNVWLRFSNDEEELIPALIYNVSVEKDGRALVTFKINQNVENLINYRKVNFDIVWSSFEGLKLPLSSVKKGTFVEITASNKQQIDGMHNGDSVSLRIEGTSGKPIPAVVYDISKMSEGKYNVEFILTKRPENFVNGAEVNTQVDWKGKDNSSIPSTFYGKYLEKDGVMTTKTNYAEFEEVKVLKQDKEYAIVNEVNSIFDKGIALYEEILVNSSNIEEGRQIRRWDF